MTPTQIAVTHHEVLFLEHSATTQEADLFNNLHRIMVTNIPKDKWPKIPKTDEMWAQIKKVNMAAHNPYPGAQSAAYLWLGGVLTIPLPRCRVG